MSVPLAIDPVVMRDQSDCGVATLAMLTGRPYREVAEMALGRFPNVLSSGLWMTELAALAEALGYRLVKSKLEDDATGVIVFVRGRKWSHVAVLFRGVLINPADALVWDLDAYLQAKSSVGRGKARIHSFHVLEPAGSKG